MASEINWMLCCLCQTKQSEPLVCPANSKRKDAGADYTTLALNLSQLQELEEKSFGVDINLLDSGEGIEATLNINRACWHKSCRNKVNSTEVKRVAKRKRESGDHDVGNPSQVKTRRSIASNIDEQSQENQCLFCDKSDGILHKASTFQVDSTVRKYATELNDTRLVSKLAAGDMVAIDALYHGKCIVAFYNRAGQNYRDSKENDENSRLHAIAFAELVSYMEDFTENQESLPLFTLAELSKLYYSILDNLGADQASRIHSTRLKEKLAAEFPDLISYKSGRDIVLTFDKHMGDIIERAREHENDSEAKHLAKSAHIIRRDIFAHKNELFDGSFPINCQSSSVPVSLKALINMILDGPCSKVDCLDADSTSNASLSISQLVSFNCVKKRSTRSNDNDNETKPFVRHNKDRETPLPLYIGLKIHAETRNKSLIEAMCKLGLSISYDRVMSISADAANTVCNRYEQEGVVCPPKLRENLFTTR